MTDPMPMMALVKVHGVVFKLTANIGAIAPERFCRYVDKFRRMGLVATEHDAEAIRDELLILDSLGKGVPLVSLISYHPFSALRSEEKEDAAQIMIKTFDPTTHVTPPSDDA